MLYGQRSGFISCIHLESVCKGGTRLIKTEMQTVQLTPNGHENGKENSCPIIKKVGDLRKRTYQLINNFTHMIFTLTSELHADNRKG